MQNFSWILHELVGNLLWSAGQISVSNQACGNGHQPEGIEFHRRERNWLWLLKTEEVFWISCNFQFVEWLSIVAKLEREILNVEHWQALTRCLLTVSRSWIPWGEIGMRIKSGKWDTTIKIPIYVSELIPIPKYQNQCKHQNTKIPKPIPIPIACMHGRSAIAIKIRIKPMSWIREGCLSFPVWMLLSWRRCSSLPFSLLNVRKIGWNFHDNFLNHPYIGLWRVLRCSADILVSPTRSMGGDLQQLGWKRWPKFAGR